jgi:hypothetical protein
MTDRSPVLAKNHIPACPRWKDHGGTGTSPVGVAVHRGSPLEVNGGPPFCHPAVYRSKRKSQTRSICDFGSS